MIFNEHPSYFNMKGDLKKVRDCIAGEPTIKRHATDYLKHPNMLDTTSSQQRARYEKYIEGAEFDEIPSETEASMLGQMTDGEISLEVPDLISYLEEDCDGDGMPLDGAVEIVYKNVLEAGYHILLAELNGLSDLDIKDLSIADLKKINPRATIKQYTRESLVDWDFKRINGVMQLSLLVLREIGQERELSTLVKNTVTSYLVLALDNDGNYFQQKYVTQTDGKSFTEDGEPYYPMVGGENLRWIPAEIVYDKKVPAGMIPESLGYLYRVCAISLYRYQVSADYKEAMRMIQPTTFTTGWRSGGWAEFEEMNGRDFIAFGAGVANNLPEGVEVDIKGMGVEAEPFERYFEQNATKARSLGAVFGDEKRNAETATQVNVDNNRSSAVMRSIVKNTERAMVRMMAYCAMYMGAFNQDQIEDNIDSFLLRLPCDFGLPRMTVDEVAKSVSGGLISKAEGTRILVGAGMTVEDVDTILAEIEDQGPEIGSLPYVQEVTSIQQKAASVATDDETL